MSDQKAIEATIGEFIKAYDAGDIASLLAYYGDDLIKLRSGAPAETKLDTALRVAEVFSQFHSRVEVVTDEIVRRIRVHSRQLSRHPNAKERG